MTLPPSRTVPVTTPLTWAAGIALLGAALWLPGIFAIVRAAAALVR